MVIIKESTTASHNEKYIIDIGTMSIEIIVAIYMEVTMCACNYGFSLEFLS